MIGIRETAVRVNGHSCRVWQKGEGERVGYLAGIGGLPRWTPFLDALARHRTVVAPSVPGFPGASGHRLLDDHLDWLLATRDLLDAAGLTGSDLIAVSVATALAADVAAVWERLVRRLVLVGPFGLFDPADPIADIWAQRPSAFPALVSQRPATFAEFNAPPDGMPVLEWEIIIGRALEAAARYLFPLGETGLAKRLPRLRCPVLLLRGEWDRVIPAGQLARFASCTSARVQTATIENAGHLADMDEPMSTCQRVLEFLSMRID